MGKLRRACHFEPPCVEKFFQIFLAYLGMAFQPTARREIFSRIWGKISPFGRNDMDEKTHILSATRVSIIKPYIWPIMGARLFSLAKVFGEKKTFLFGDSLDSPPLRHSSRMGVCAAERNISQRDALRASGFRFASAAAIDGEIPSENPPRRFGARDPASGRGRGIQSERLREIHPRRAGKTGGRGRGGLPSRNDSRGDAFGEARSLLLAHSPARSEILSRNVVAFCGVHPEKRCPLFSARVSGEASGGGGARVVGTFRAPRPPFGERGGAVEPDFRLPLFEKRATLSGRRGCL